MAFGIDIVGTIITLLALPSIDYLFPSRIPFVDEMTTHGYVMNVFVQIFPLVSLGFFFGSLFLILILYILYFINQLQVLERFCGQIGKYEEKQIMDRLTIKRNDKVVAWNCNGVSVEQEGELVESENYLRLIVNLQSEVIR